MADSQVDLAMPYGIDIGSFLLLSTMGGLLCIPQNLIFIRHTYGGFISANEQLQ
jgi:hypothetical protein